MCGVVVNLVLFLCLLSVSVSAEAQVIKDIKLEAQGQNTKVVFDFGIPLHYVRHFPTKAGEILQIQLLIDSETGHQVQKEIRQGSDLSPPPGLDPLLVYVTYEDGVPGGPYLTLRFVRPVSFEVDAGDSLSSLSVVIRDDQARHPLAKSTPQQKAQQESKLSASGIPSVPPAKGEIPITMEALKEQVFKEKPSAEQPKPEASAPEQAAAPEATQTKGESKKDEVGELMAKARQALTFGDNEGAIQLLRRVIAMPESEYTQDARELIGLAFERANHIPQAQFEYKKYLKLYKEGEGATRVAQRLQALQSLDTEQPKKLRKTVRKDQDVFTVFGRLSQSFLTRYEQRQPDSSVNNATSEDVVLTRRVDSFLSLRGRMRAEDRNLQAVFTGSHAWDTMDDTNTEFRVSQFYLDYDVFSQGYYTILGRQQVRNSGVFGRFDGIIAGYDFLPFMRGHVYFGKPVQLYDDREIDREFWGLKVDIGNRNDALNINLYSVNQTADGFADRQAFGAGVRYTDKTMTLFGLADYDFLFNELNLFNVRWVWKYFDNSKLNVSYNRRQLLFVTSALNNQPLTTTLQDVVDLLSEDGARQLAKDRTSMSETFDIGNSYQFNRDNQLSVDLLVFKSSGTVTRNDLAYPTTLGGCAPVVPNAIQDCVMINVAGLPDTGNQYTLSAQWISGNLFAQQDLYVFGTRLTQYDAYNDINLFTNVRLPSINSWRLSPRLNLIYRAFSKDSATEGTMSSIAPSISVSYLWKKVWSFDMDFGVEVVQYTDPSFDDQIRENIRIGYNYSF